MENEYNREEQEIEELSKSITLESILLEMDDAQPYEEITDSGEKKTGKSTAKAGKRQAPRHLRAEEPETKPEEKIPEAENQDTMTLTDRTDIKQGFSRPSKGVNEPDIPQISKEKSDRTKKRVPEKPAQPGEQEKPTVQTLSDVIGSVVVSELEAQERKRRGNAFTQRLRALQRLKQDLFRHENRRYGDKEETFQEIDASQVSRDLKKNELNYRSSCLLGGLCVCILLSMGVCEEAGWISEEMQQIPYYQMITGCILLVDNLIQKCVWKSAVKKLKSGWISFELAACLINTVTLVYCVAACIRTPQQPVLALPSAAVLLFTDIGLYTKTRADCRAYRLIKKWGIPASSIVPVKEGVVRKKGGLLGFYETMTRETACDRLEKVMVPLILVSTIVLAVISYSETGDGNVTLWVWNLMLCMGFPLVQAIAKSCAYAVVQQYFSKKDIAVAGFSGGCPYVRMKRIILTEEELFPRGQIVFDGYKTVTAEDPKKVLSYAASIARAGESYLQPSFEREMSEQGCYYCQASDLHYYEEGGVSAVIHGETVLFGNAAFMKEQRISITPSKRKNAMIYLAIDGALAGYFGFTYSASPNVVWALRVLRRNHIRPVLAVRSSNVTANMIEEKFKVKTKAVFPKIDDRVKLGHYAKEEAEKNTLLIYRGELMGMVEAAVASKKMVRITWTIMILSYLISSMGLFLASYFAGVQSFSTLTPLNLFIFNLMLLLPCLLIGRFSKLI